MPNISTTGVGELRTTLAARFPGRKDVMDGALAAVLAGEHVQKIYTALAAPLSEEAIERTDAQATGRGYSTVGAVGDGGYISFNEADSIKGAVLCLLGCGRQAYEGTLDDDNLPPEGNADGVTVTTLPTPGSARPSVTNVPHVAAPSTSAAPPLPAPKLPAPPSRSRLSSKQLAAIWAIGRKLGYEQQALRQFVKGKFGVQPEFLSRDAASQLIGAMSEQAGNGADHHREPGAEG